MANTYVDYTGDGSQDTFSITFPYLSNTHVTVRVATVAKTEGTHYNISTGNIVFTAGNIPAAATAVRIVRVTERVSPLVDFKDGSTLLEADLDTANRQSFYISQETDEGALVADVDGNWDADSKKIVNLAAPTADTDAVNKDYVDNEVSHAFTDLSDTPSSLTANKWLKVNSAGTALEETAAPEGTSSWYVQSFDGDGSAVAFTLSQAPASENNTQVYISGVYQQKDTYSVSGTTLTFSEAPGAGTGNIEVATIETTAMGTTSSDLVTFSPTGTGATDRTTQAKLRDTVSVEDFGATGDGTTDDRAAIQAAVDHMETQGGGTVLLSSNKNYAVGSAINLGVSGAEVFLDGNGGKNGATIIAKTAFTGGVIIISQGGVKDLNATGAGVDTSGHVFITMGTASVTNPRITIENILNNGGFYDFVKTIYEYDAAVIDRVTSIVDIGHACLDLQTGSAYSPAANPRITNLFLRNPDTTPVVGDAKKYGLILNKSEGAKVTGQMSNFDIGLQESTTSDLANRELSLNNLLVLDLRSTPSNDLWESAWAATTAYSLDDYRKPTAVNVNGHFYIVTTAGTSGGSEPTWPTVHNSTVVDGTVTWTEVGQSVAVEIGFGQQVSIRNVRFENGIVALKNAGNANYLIDSSRLVGEPTAYVNLATSNSELIMSNCLTSGDIRLVNGSVKTRFIGVNNSILAETANEVPDHEVGSFSTENYAFESGNGIDFSDTSAAGATAQVLDNYAEGVWTPTVTANANCTSPAISTARYTRVGRLVFCEVEGTVDITATDLDTNFKFTLPFDMFDASTSALASSIYIYVGGTGMALIADWTGTNATDVGLLLPATFVSATGEKAFTGGFVYNSN